MRAITSDTNPGASAEAIADAANSNAAIFRTGRRPMRSLSGPESIMPRVAVSASEDTDQPTWIGVSANSTSMNPTTPEMTEASKPMRKPPRATISAVVVMKPVDRCIPHAPVQSAATSRNAAPRSASELPPTQRWNSPGSAIRSSSRP